MKQLVRASVAVVLLVLLEGQCFSEFSRAITLTPSISEDVDGFPLLIRISDPSIFSKAMDHGEDLVFLDHGQRNLPFEIVSWDAARHESEIWVRVPKLRSEASTVIYLRYGATDVVEAEC